MPGPDLGSVSLISQIPGDFLGLSASQWFWLAIAGWSLAIVLGGAFLVRLSGASAHSGPATDDLERVELETPALLRAITPDEDVVGGVLRWLLSEVDADAVALLELSPRGEVLRVEPRGLEAATVASLAGAARRSLLGSDDQAGGASVIRWLGVAGTNVLVAVGASGGGGEEPFRFSRYLLEWVRATERRGRPRAELEDRLRGIAGVAWAEVVGRSARLLPTDDPGAVELAQPEVERQLGGTDVVAEWLELPAARGPEVVSPVVTSPPEPMVVLSDEPTGPEAEPISTEAIGSEERLVSSAIGRQEPRIRLLDVALSENGDATADVRVGWNEQEIRGRGHGRATRAGRYFAAAQAVADALRPLLDTEVVIEGLYVATTKEGVDVLISEVRLEGQRYVGAVLESADRPDWTGARAVLDAVNRRLVQLAGRSGRV